MRDKGKDFISAVIYVHDAEDRIGSLLRVVMMTLGNDFVYAEIICVDDGSSDGSVERIRETAREAEGICVSILHLSHYHGMETAMSAGMDLAIGDFVFEFDQSFLDYDSMQILEAYQKALEGYDIVRASPDTREALTSRLFYKLFERFSDIPYTLHTESFRILSRRAVNRINSMNKMVLYRKAAYADCGLKTASIRYPPNGAEGRERRMAGSSRAERRYRRQLALDALILLTEVGYRFSVTMTMSMMGLTLFMAVYSVVVYLFQDPVEGWTTTVLFLSVAFFGLFGILTIIIRYLQILVRLESKHKRYSFESIEKLNG